MAGEAGIEAVYLAILVAMLSTALALAALPIARRSRRKKVVKATITVIKCAACGYTLRRPFRRGDYVGKEEERCPKCGEVMLIDAIFEESGGPGTRRTSL